MLHPTSYVVPPFAVRSVTGFGAGAKTLRRGDGQKLGETDWIVRAVVPTDGKGKAFGWVELGPKNKGDDR